MKLNSILDRGFPLDVPDLLLPWGAPLEEIARMTGGAWRGDRFMFGPASYLGGLNYPLQSSNRHPRTAAFNELISLVGLNGNGLWSDSSSLEGFDLVSDHLTKLLGEASARNIDPSGEKSSTWKVNGISFDLAVIDQHAFKCYLTVSRIP